MGGELLALLCYERGLATQPLLETLMERRGGDHPPDVRQAADRLLHTLAPWALDLAGSATMLVECAGDERRVRLFRGWAFEGRSLEDLARQEGIARQVASWNARRGGALVREAASAAPPWPWLVSTARRNLGAVTSGEALDTVLARLGVTTAAEAELLTWLAGPYHPVSKRPGWLAIDPRPVVGRTVGCLGNDGGVRRLGDVVAELADLEIAADQLPAWIAANGSTVVHDLAVLVTGPLPDAVERVLDAHGTERTPDQIEGDLAAGGRVVGQNTVERAVRGSRFTRSTKGAIRLAAWGAETQPSTKEPYHRRAKRHRTKLPRAAAEQVPVAEARLWLWVRVDDEVLHGSEGAVPASLVEGLGLAPLARRTFSSRWGPVTLSHDGAQPTRGSVRAVALAAGANPDDTLLLGFSAAGDVAVEVRRGPGQVSLPEAGAAALVLFSELEFVNGGTP